MIEPDAAISAVDKSFPAETLGWRPADFAAAHLGLDDFQTPLLTLDASRLAHNVAVMAEWCAAQGFDLAPHGKTTMSPTLWQQQLDAGAWGITLATPWQVRVARDAGVRRILLANALVDPVALRAIASELDAHPEFEFFCWADSVDAVLLMESVLAGAGAERTVNVIVELGAPGGRTGARSVDAATAVAAAVADSGALALVGCGGYEGAVAHDRSEVGLGNITSYLESIVELHSRLASSYEVESPIITVGGSAYLDQVSAVLGPIAAAATVVVRAGAYIVHDDGFYRSISPLDAGVIDGGLRSAMHGWARVISRPEPSLAILDGGKRDFPVDEGLPVSLDLPGATITALNDQHAFLRLPPDSDNTTLPVGSVVRLGLSHPCTALDKWRAVPIIDSLERGRVTGFIRTYF